MKLQYSIIYLAILKVASCYPSTGENESQRSSENSSISVSRPLSSLDESQVAKDNLFPEVEYPTKFLDIIHPFYYCAADHTDSLAPNGATVLSNPNESLTSVVNTSDVKDSFGSLQAEQKVKEQSAHQDSISPRDIDIQQTIKGSDDLIVNDPSSYNVVVNTSEVSVREDHLKAASEEQVEIPDDTNSQINLDNEAIDPTSEEEMEISDDTISQFNVNNENVQPTSEKEVEISDGTNRQHNVDSDNIEPTGIPADSTDTSVTTLDDTSENSDEIVSFDDEN